jgi:hypothetical protein
VRAHPAVVSSPKRRCGCRGTGAVKATGSYEGSLSVEGISDRHEPGSFTRGWSRRSWRFPRHGVGELVHTSSRRDAKALRYSAQEGAATEVSEARSNRAPWEDNAHAHGPSAHRVARGTWGAKCACSNPIRRSGRGCRETPGPLVMPHGAQTPWGFHAVKAAVASQERARYGCTQIVQVAEVGWTHRASCPPGGRKASWRARALARRKLEALPDAGHE